VECEWVHGLGLGLEVRVRVGVEVRVMLILAGTPIMYVLMAWVVF
jgi:hypothetical protein